MKQLLYLLLFFFSSHFVFSQSELLVLKQKNRIIQTWVPGSFINFQFSSKQWIQGIVRIIRNDSIIIDQVMLVQTQTQLGFLRNDTAHLGLMKLHLNEIYGMPKRNFSSGIISNGKLFQLGSGAYIFLNLVNTLIYKERLFSEVNATRLGIAGGVFLIGTLLAASHKTYIILGKKYMIATIH